MKNTNTIAELSLLVTATGAGIVEPFKSRIANTAVITSAIHYDTQKAFNRAEVEFLSKTKDAAHLEQEEDEQDSASAALAAVGQGEKRDKKKKDNKMNSLITWRDPNSCRTTVIQMMNRSIYKTLTIFDPSGSRLAVALTVPARTASEGALIELTGEGSAQVSLIRSAVSGGATIHGSMKQGTRLNYLSCMAERQLRKIRKKMAKEIRFSGWRRHSVMIPGWEEDKSGLNLKDSDFTWFFDNVLMRADKPIEITIDNPEQWEEFFEQSHEQVLGKEMSDASHAKIREAPASLSTILYHASRVAVAEVMLKASRAGSTDYRLTSESLETARYAAQQILHFACSIDVFETRAANAALGAAAASKAISTEKLLQGAKTVMDAIEASDKRMLSRWQVLKLPGISVKVLDALVTNKMIGELCGTSEINMGRTTRAYVFPSEWMQEDDEAEAELELAVQAYQENNDSVTKQDTDETSVTLTEKATNNRSAGKGPVVELAEMNSHELRALPAILHRLHNYFHYKKNYGLIVRKDQLGRDLSNWNLDLVYAVDEWKGKS